MEQGLQVNKQNRKWTESSGDAIHSLSYVELPPPSHPLPPQSQEQGSLSRNSSLSFLCEPWDGAPWHSQPRGSSPCQLRTLSFLHKGCPWIWGALRRQVPFCLVLFVRETPFPGADAVF